MTNKELKIEKENIKNTLYEKINSINNKSVLNNIYNKLKNLNDYLDDVDSKVDNFFDVLTNKISDGAKKIKNTINDILDNYDKIDKDGNPKYTDEQRRRIYEIVKEIDDICNQDFFSRFKKILGIGT